MRERSDQPRNCCYASTDAQREALAGIGLTEDVAKALDAAAAAALAAETEAAGAPADARVTQRELDLGDGAVVHLVGVVYRAFREATAALPALVVPPLGELVRCFARPAAKAPAAKPPAPAPTPPADPTGPTG